MNTSSSIAQWQAIVAAPGFALGLACTDDEITAIEFLSPRAEIAPQTALAQEAARQLQSYLSDAHHCFTLPLAAAGTPFQRRVWAGIAAIPAGATRSYGDLAQDLYSGARAVGNACGANPYPLVVPCHRVVGGGGGLGGFARNRDGFLLGVKRWLLHHEGSLPS